MEGKENMGRLTRRTGRFNTSALKGNGCSYAAFSYSCDSDCEEARELLNNAMEKLAEYEDFEEIFRSKMTDDTCNFLKDKEEFAKWLDRNKWIAKKCDEYARAEEQGKLLKLPCEIGHRVYMIYQFFGEGAWEIEEHKIRLEDLENIGKTVFLTREEAEAALKEMSVGLCEKLN